MLNQVLILAGGISGSYCCTRFRLPQIIDEAQNAITKHLNDFDIDIKIKDFTLSTLKNTASFQITPSEKSIKEITAILINACSEVFLSASVGCIFGVFAALFIIKVGQLGKEPALMEDKVTTP